VVVGLTCRAIQLAGRSFVCRAPVTCPPPPTAEGEELSAQSEPDGGGDVSGDGSRIRPRAYPLSSTMFQFRRGRYAPPFTIDVGAGTCAFARPIHFVRPKEPLKAWRDNTLCIVVRSIGEGARLTIKDDRLGRPRLRRWQKPAPGGAAGPPIAQSGEARGSVRPCVLIAAAPDKIEGGAR
jgi:hypothetical protein